MFSIRAMMIETVSSSETSSSICHTTRHNVAEDSHFYSNILSFQVAALLLFAHFAESDSRATIFYLHEDGFANEISIETDPQMELVKINKDMQHVTFNLSLGFVKRSDNFYRRMRNRTIVVYTDNVSRPNVPEVLCTAR
jgi:hypothetical protein